MTSMSLAIWLVNRYPHAWRLRYEEEMLALLEQHRVTFLTMLDLLFGMIKARVDPQYRDNPGPVLFTSLPRATWIALAAWGVFVLCAAVMGASIDLSLVFSLTGHSGLSSGACCGSVLTMPGEQSGLEVMTGVVGSQLWFTQPVTVLLPLFAITALVCLGCLRWAVRTRRWGIIGLTTVWFALPMTIIFWLVTASPTSAWLHPFFQVNVLDFHTGRQFQLPFFPLSLVTTVGELEALMAVLFLSVLRARQALRTQQYRLLGLVVGVNLTLILIVVYLVQGWNLFTPNATFATYGPILPPDYLQNLYTVEALGLCAHLLPFAAVGLLLLALAGHALGKQGWRAVVLGLRLLAGLMAVCAVCFLVGIVIAWQIGEGMYAVPVLWLLDSNNNWRFVFGIPTGALWATMVLALVVVLRALRTMRAASTTADAALHVPA